MAQFVAAVACLLMGFAASQAVFFALTRPRRPHAVTLERLRARLLSSLELLGHWAPLVRLGNKAPLRSYSERLRATLERRRIPLSRHGCFAAALASMLAAALACALASGSVLGAPVGVLGAAAVLATAVGRHERSVRVESTAQMPEVLRSLSAALGAGKSLAQAIEHVGRNVSEPMGSQFLQASFEIQGGRSVEEAVGALCSRTDAPGMALVGTALQISQRTGSSLNDLLARTARMVAGTVELRRELAVKTSQARLSAKVVAGMPVALACILTLVSPDYRAGLSLPAGGACLCVAALLDIVALVMVHRLMQRSLR